jgi:hypothetical protein
MTPPRKYRESHKAFSPVEALILIKKESAEQATFNGKILSPLKY